jgi:hypothetical protein
MEPAKKKDREEYQLQQMMLQLQQKEADRLKRRAADRQGPFTDPAPVNVYSLTSLIPSADEFRIE